MPYVVERIGEQFCVFLERAPDRTRDAALGCHDTIADAYAQVAAIEASEDDGTKADADDIAQRYDDYYATVNMTATQLERWAATECSKLASDSRAPIERNLTLLRTNKDEWGDSEYKAAGQTISFVSRMKGVEQGDPVKEGCPSARDISLKNWAYDPTKMTLAPPTKAQPGDLSVGDFVRWDSSGGTARGRITRIATSGSIDVPDSSFTIDASEDDPAALIRIYREGSDGWEATDTYAGHRFSTLTKIDDLKGDGVTYQRKAMNVFVVNTKQDGDEGIVEAYTSVMGNIDHGRDIIRNGAYKKTIAERGSAGKVRVLDNHRTGSVTDTVARVVALREVGREMLPDALLRAYPDATGALYTKMAFMLDDAKSLAVFSRIKNNFIDEYSIGFEIIQSDMEERRTDEGTMQVRVIKEIKLYEVSPVIFGMNDATMTVGAKNADMDDGAGGGATMPPNYRPSDSAAMCKGCKAYIAVDGEKGACKAYSIACKADYVCDSYAPRDDAPRTTAGERMMRDYKAWMKMECNAMCEAGAWTDDERERVMSMLDEMAGAMVAMLPDEMREREMPPENMTAPKHDTNKSGAGSRDNAPTSPSPLNEHDRLETIKRIRLRQIDGRRKQWS